MSAVLQRQAMRWQKQEKKGDLPEGLYEALADGSSSSYEKRIIVNLAKISTIVRPEGGVRPYSEFSKDWHYEGSIYGHADNCELCGAAIKENCRLKNHDSDREILIGNVCVYRYIEIRDESGRALNDAEKKEFLKAEMGEAKKEFLRQDFATRYPTALANLKRWEQMMTAKYSRWKTLYRTVNKRLITHGYLGPKTMKEWEQFHEQAEELNEAFHQRMKTRALERNARLEGNRMKREAFLKELNERRNQYSREADEFIAFVDEIDFPLNDWERGMVGRIQSKIRTQGRGGLTDGYARFVVELEARKNLDTTTLSDRATQLMLLKDEGKLNEWEASFVESIITRMAMKKSLTPNQEKVVKRLLKEDG